MHRLSSFALSLASSSLLAVVAACSNPGAELQELAFDNRCAVDADCCVVVDDCNSEAFLVEAGEFDAALDLVAQRQQDFCAGCIVPTVVTECFEGRCIGRAFSPVDVNPAPGSPSSVCGPRELVNSGSQDIGYVDVVDGYATCGDAF